MLAVFTEIPAYAIWSVVIMLVGTLLAVIAKRASDRHEAARIARERNEAERLRIADEQRAHVERLALLNAQRRSSMILTVNGILERMNGRENARSIHGQSLQALSMVVLELAPALETDTRRVDLNREWQAYQQLGHGIPVAGTMRHPSGNMVLDHSVGYAILRPALERLRSFAE
jgi:hypothetical protein